MKAAKTSGHRPNILFITCDQLRKDALGCYGNSVIRTPQIDSIAERGRRLENLFVVSPVCSPSRASLATGRYPSVHGLKVNGVCLPKEELTAMEVLRRAGYRTYGCGKMHFCPQWDYQAAEMHAVCKHPDPLRAIDPQPHPWEFPYYGLEKCALVEDHNAGPYGDYLRQHGLDPWEDPHSFTFPQSITKRSAIPVEHSKTTWITDRALDFLGSHSEEEPFFAWVSYVHPHHPFVVPAPYDTMYNPSDMPLPAISAGEEEKWPNCYKAAFTRENGGHEAVGMHKFGDEDWRRIKAFYYGMISHVDDQIGRLLAALEASGQRENTIIVFTADHGELLGDHRLLFKAAFYDSVLNTPFLVEGPGLGNAGADQALVSSLEIAPTLLGLCGIEVPPSMQAAGFSDALRSQDPVPSRPEVLTESPMGARSLRTASARITCHSRGDSGELYDLENDPHCFRNLWNDPDDLLLKTQMLERLVSAMTSAVDPLPSRVTVC